MEALLPLLATPLLLVPLQEAAPKEGVGLELRVNRAIARAVEYLKQQQLPQGGFPGFEGQHPGGITALAAYALCKSGVRRNDEALARAVRALEGNEFKSTYSAAVHLLLCEALPDRDAHRAAAQKCLDFLVENQQQGIWSYPGAHLCGSNTQFALLGLRAARRMGLSVPEATLVAAVEGLWQLQDRSGGFVYQPGGRPYAGMTAAGLSDLAVLEEFGAGSRQVRTGLRQREKERASAEAWLGARFDATRNLYGNGAWTPSWHYAYMWAIERWCGLTGREEIAGHDWYAEGAAWLVDTQAPDGSWTSADRPLENTCLVLLFLRRATISAGEELEEIYQEIDRDRAQAEPFDQRPGPEAGWVERWWIAGPWQGKEDGALLSAPPFDPREVRPKARTKLARRAWEPISVPSGNWSDLDALTGRGGDLTLWCLSTTLAYAPDPGEPGEPLQALLWLYLEDGWDVWLDGARLSRERRVGSAIVGDVRVPLSLSPGEHLLVVLVEDVGGAAAFGARLSDALNGSAPPTLTTSIAPAEAKAR